MSEKTRKQLSKIDPRQKKLLVGWIEKSLQARNKPRYFGKPLEGDLPIWFWILFLIAAFLMAFWMA